jgi:hypothetical protein
VIPSFLLILPGTKWRTNSESRLLPKTEFLDSKNRSVGTTGYKAFWCALGSVRRVRARAALLGRFPPGRARRAAQRGTQGNPHNPHTL